MYLHFKTISSLAYTSQNIRTSTFILILFKWNSCEMVGRFSAPQLGLTTVPTSLVQLNCLPSLPIGSPPSRLLSLSGIAAVAIKILQISPRCSRKIWLLVLQGSQLLFVNPALLERCIPIHSHLLLHGLLNHLSWFTWIYMDLSLLQHAKYTATG